MQYFDVLIKPEVGPPVDDADGDETLNLAQVNDDDGDKSDDNHESVVDYDGVENGSEVQGHDMAIEHQTTSVMSTLKGLTAQKNRTNEKRSAPINFSNAKLTKNRKTTTDDSSRYDQMSHWPLHDNKSNRSRCKNSKCKKFTNWFCSKCNKHFCIKPNGNCFTEYHNH